MSNNPEAFNHEISVELASLIPEEVRNDPVRLDDWVNRALEIGFKAMIEGSGSVDLSFVSKEFEGWKQAISGKLIGEDSDFEKGLENWLTAPDGTFQRAFDLSDPNSPLSKFMSQQTTDRETHEKGVKELFDQIVGLWNKDDAPKQAKTQGDQFEDDIESFLTNVKVAEDEVRGTGEEAVEGSGGDKKGDILIEVGHPSTDDLKITIEAKSGKSQGAYTLTGPDSLWNQMSTSMSLLPAQASIGVVDINNVKQHKPWLDQGRYKIVVAVDWEDMNFTLLEVAYSVLRYRIIQDLAYQESVAAEPNIDLSQFDELITEISQNTEILRGMRVNLTKMGGMIDNQDSQINDLERANNSQVQQLRILLQSAQSEQE